MTTATVAQPLRLGQETRRRIVEKLTHTVSGAKAVFLCTLHKVPVSDVEILRRSLSTVSTELAVVKNSLGRRALTASGLNALEPLLEGTSLLGVSRADPVAASRVLVTFAKEHEGFTVRGAVVEGQTLPLGDIQALAELPPRQVLLAKLFGSMQAPIARFVGVLGGVPRQLVTAMEVIRQLKESK